MTINANTCIECGQDWDDHTVRDFRAHWGAAHPPIDIPFEQADLTAEPIMADFVSIGAALAKLPAPSQIAGADQIIPVLYYRFRQGPKDICEIGLLISEEQLRALRLLTSNAIDAALKAARRARGR